MEKRREGDGGEEKRREGDGREEKEGGRWLWRRGGTEMVVRRRGGKDMVERRKKEEGGCGEEEGRRW